jgi:hypothetical protein
VKEARLQISARTLSKIEGKTTKNRDICSESDIKTHQQPLMPDTRLVVRLMQKWTVPLLLVVVALRQLVLAHTVGLSAWHGGGFGMFASIDRDERRAIEVTGIDRQGRAVEIDSTALRDLFTENDLLLIRTFPSKALLQDIAKKILDFDLYEDERGEISLQPGPAKPEQFIRLEKVKVRVWRLYHDRKTSRIWYEPLSPAVEVSR